MPWGASSDMERETAANDASDDATGGVTDQVTVPVPVPRPFQHILDVSVKASTKDKSCNALKHFQFYASQHFGKVIEADMVSYAELNQDLFGGLATDLATAAHYYRELITTVTQGKNCFLSILHRVTFLPSRCTM
jgi:hypothetical protein